MSKRPSMIFPDVSSVSSRRGVVIFSKDEIRSACNFLLIGNLIGSIANYAVEKNRTKEMKKQYQAKKEAVDTEYTEAEKQAQIIFSENCKRLAEEYREKNAELDMALKKAEAEADKDYLKFGIAFERCVKTSEQYRIVFDILKEYTDKLLQMLKEMQEKDYYTHTKYYIELSEKYREQIREIEKYSQMII